jgi:hypothetical protein
MKRAPTEADASVDEKKPRGSGGISMCRCLSIVCFLALMAQGCAKNPPVIPLSALNVDYRTWSCRQLAEETDLLRDALAVASKQHSDETVAHLKVETESVHKASVSKKCSA